MNKISAYLILVFTILTLTSCCQLQPPCQLRSLLLDSTFFPEGTTAGEVISPMYEEPSNSAAATFYYTEKVMILNYVIDYSSRYRAKNEYGDYLDVAFSEDKYLGPWVTSNSNYNSSTARQFNLACGQAGGTQVCRYLALYGSYVVYLQVDNVTHEGFSEADFLLLVNAIDDKFETCFSSNSK